MQSVKVFIKENISENYNDKVLDNNYPLQDFENIYKDIENSCPELSRESALEISHNFTNAYKITSKEFKKVSFISDDPFESLLVFHKSQMNGININVMNHVFNHDSLSSLKMNESYDFVYSYFGLNFEDLYTILPLIIGFLKVGGILALSIPAYWYIKDNMTETEETIIKYSKQNDKKWVFTEPISPIIEKNGGEIISLKENGLTIKINRTELARISSLTKLYDASINNNAAHLEIVEIPEDNIELRASLLLIQKKQKTVTKDNLFNL